MDTSALAVLSAAATAGSISGAARRLGVPVLVASRRLVALERELGVRLLQRTTRSASLTPEGEALMPFAEEMLASEVAARATLSPDEVGATGLLRATAPASLGRQVIIPLLPKLFADNPHLRVELNLTERLVDVVGEGLDVAIRIADLRESNLITRRVGTLRRLLCASPEYLARRGRPNSVADLADHDCLTLVGTSHWTFVRNGKQERMKVAGPMSSTTIDGLHAACLYGLGISMHATWSVSDDLKAGRLVELELDAPPYAPAISALFPSSRMVAPKLRVFLSAITAALLHEA